MTDDRTSEDMMLEFFHDIPRIAHAYELGVAEILSVFAKVLVQAHMHLDDGGKEEFLSDMSTIYDYELNQIKSKGVH